MTGGIAFGATITGGIQDVAGLLPLLGTEQCEEHIGSALTGGYLYSAAAPMSLFGSLGVARAEFKTFIACMSGRTWSGAKILANMGFEPKGVNLSLVMIDKDDKDGRHLAETRLDELVNELHIDKSRVTISRKCARWNVTMILLTAFLSSLSMIPYIHLNYRGTNLTHFSQWIFPILRAVGGFLTATMMQIVIERRIGRLTTNHLAEFNTSQTLDHTGGSSRDVPGNTTTGNMELPAVDDVRGLRPADHNSGTGDVEKGLGITDATDSADNRIPTEGKPDSISPQHDAANEGNGALDWVFFVLLLTGILSSVVGYVGCFSVVQNARSPTGALSWLCLEAGLSFTRMILWGLNPKGDDAPPLELVLRLDRDTILPTCNLDDAHILRENVLPLTRSTQFLNTITSFVGLVERFTHPDLTLYYTLTRKQPIVDPKSPNDAGKRVLYITIFDHKERTTRVYTQDGTTERFFSTESDVPLIDLRHGLLDTKLDEEIISKDDLIAGDPEIHYMLRRHYQSIMDQIHFTLGENVNALPPALASPSLSPVYAIENRWTLKASDTMGARERFRSEEIKSSQGTWGSTVVRGRIIEVDGSQPTFERDRLYFQHKQIEQMRQSLDAPRGRWIDRYMELVTQETRDCLEDELTIMRRIDGEPAENEKVAGKKALRSDQELDPEVALTLVETGFIDERYLMEKLLVYEVEAWEGLVWNRVKEFMDRGDMPESGKKQLTREWQGNCWRRLDANIRAMDSRLELAKAKINTLHSNELTSNLNSKLKNVHEEIRNAWQSVMKQFVDAPTPSALSTPRSRFSEDIDRLRRNASFQGYFLNSVRVPTARIEQRHQEMARRLEKELIDVEFRIAQGLDRCDHFFDDELLLKCRHSRSRSLILDSVNRKAPLDFCSRALKGNGNVTRIVLYCKSIQEYASMAEMIFCLPLVNSLRVGDRQQLPTIKRDTPLFVYDLNFPSQSINLKTFLQNDALLIHSSDTHIFTQHTFTTQVIAVSFVGPPSGNLILRLKHRAGGPDATLTVSGTSFTLAIPESLTIDDTTLHPIGCSPSRLSFMPNARNNLILRTSLHKYVLHDLQLLTEDGKPYV